MGIKCSDRDLKALKMQLQELLSKKENLSNLSDEELSEIMGGIRWREFNNFMGKYGKYIVIGEAVVDAIHKMKKRDNVPMKLEDI